jgi:hypothetical protein
MPETSKNRIMIFGPKSDGTYVVEFRTDAGEALAISIPRGVTANRLHRDIKSFAKRLIAIVQPQLRSDLSRAQLKTSLPGALVHLCKED